MTALADLVDQYKRAVAPPGQFDTLYPSATEPLIIGALEDGFGEAQLYGFFGSYTLDLVAHAITPDITPAGRALIVTFASISAMRTTLSNVKGRVAYRAGPVSYEAEQQASVLTTLLTEAQRRLAALLELGRQANPVRDAVFDRYVQVVVGDTTTQFALTELP